MSLDSGTRLGPYAQPPHRILGPTLSPDGTRLIYTRLVRVGGIELWMSALSGGSPVRVVSDPKGSSYSGSWSPDGAWFVYWNILDCKNSLQKVKTTGQATPEVVKADIKRTGGWVPVWSPTGDWILTAADGVKLISPDGKTERQLSSAPATVCAFSRDGATVYCIRSGKLVSMPVAGGAEKDIAPIAPANTPASLLTPSLRMTLTPDGKSLTYSIVKTTQNLWMLSGIE